MARPVRQLSHGQWTEVRSATAAIAADSGTLTDANIPPAQALDCWGFDSIFVAVEITGGASPTMTVEALFRDADAADGSRWERLMLGARDGVTAAALANENTGALAPNANPVELRVFGARSVFLRITAVANAGSTTAWKIIAMPGKKRAVVPGAPYG
jgi:hypothetical protein